MSEDLLKPLADKAEALGIAMDASEVLHKLRDPETKIVSNDDLNRACQRLTEFLGQLSGAGIFVNALRKVQANEALGGWEKKFLTEYLTRLHDVAANFGEGLLSLPRQSHGY